MLTIRLTNPMVLRYRDYLGNIAYLGAHLTPVTNLRDAACFSEGYIPAEAMEVAHFNCFVPVYAIDEARN